MEQQRRAFVAIVLNDISLDALAAELSTTRNTIYKTMFDARRKLRAALAASGYLTLSGDAAGEVPANADPGRRS